MLEWLSKRLTGSYPLGAVRLAYIAAVVLQAPDGYGARWLLFNGPCPSPWPPYRAEPRNPASFAVARNCGIGSNSLKADVKAFDKLHNVRGWKSSCCGLK